ncbi:hypothetical protein [Bacillus sp. JJ1764]|uniref:hypothetical protein n=1 Tax=Bacillus sp. JJ1764 TaxID=3122964 RepID=UPI002FFFF955
MESIVWINGTYEEDNRIFDSSRQAEEWANALFPDLGPYLISKIDVGYATPDEKVIKYLESLLSEWAGYYNIKISIHCEMKIKDGQEIYSIRTRRV